MLYTLGKGQDIFSKEEGGGGRIAGEQVGEKLQDELTGCFKDLVSSSSVKGIPKVEFDENMVRRQLL